jgi:Holliday junction resolvasome RuvABC endonuclease subunit
LVKFAGVAIEACAALGIKIEIITATQARKYCCGTEKLDKKGVFAYFVRKYALNDWTFEKDNDKTDAMALAWGYREIRKAQIKERSSKKKGDKKEARG